MSKKTEFMFDWVAAIGNGTVKDAIEELLSLNPKHTLCFDADASYTNGYYASVVKHEQGSVDLDFETSAPGTVEAPIRVFVPLSAHLEIFASDLTRALARHGADTPGYHVILPNKLRQYLYLVGGAEPTSIAGFPLAFRADVPTITTQYGYKASVVLYDPLNPKPGGGIKAFWVEVVFPKEEG